MARTPRTNEILVQFRRFAGNVMTSLQLANFPCSSHGDEERSIFVMMLERAE